MDYLILYSVIFWMHCSLISQRLQSDKTIFSFCESIELLYYTIFGTDTYVNAHAQIQKKKDQCWHVLHTANYLEFNLPNFGWFCWKGEVQLFLFISFMFTDWLSLQELACTTLRC